MKFVLLLIWVLVSKAAFRQALNSTDCLLKLCGGSAFENANMQVSSSPPENCLEISEWAHMR